MTRLGASDVGWGGPDPSVETHTAVNEMAAAQTNRRFIESSAAVRVPPSCHKRAVQTGRFIVDEVLNQGGTVHFSADNAKAYAFTLDYAVVTIPGTLSGDEARQFFDRLGTIDAAL